MSTPSPTTPARKAYDVIHWRRQVTALYASVRSNPSPKAAHAHWQRERDQLFKTHAVSPIPLRDRAALEGLPVAPYDPAWRFEVAVQPSPAPCSFEYQTGTDGLVRFTRVGVVDVPRVGTLDVWALNGYGGGVWVPVRDALAGRPGGTYGGGRYLIDSIKGADLGEANVTQSSDVGSLQVVMVLDFNFAYNPSCAYDSAWACPLAPEGNRVDVEIPVGEMYKDPSNT